MVCIEIYVQSTTTTRIYMYSSSFFFYFFVVVVVHSMVKNGQKRESEEAQDKRIMVLSWVADIYKLIHKTFFLLKQWLLLR